MIAYIYNYPGFVFGREQDMDSVIGEIAGDYGLVLDYINIVFLNDLELLEINKEFLKHDYFTDIISFNYSEEPFHIEAELYISVDRVIENAKEITVDTENEMCRVIIHGMLHFAGFEDSEENLKLEMRILEDKYLNNFLFHVKPDINTSLQ